ncbi:uncharacterized protein [Populus alba]|uniref:uncharacterized protein n=1 Tax=Populus alba TaxID=43335 RepID=UPI003CC775C8
MSAVVGLTFSYDVWSTLETTFSHRSKSRELRFKDELQHIKKDTRSVVEYSREFKSICDQLAAMGHPIDDLDKIHWYLRGLGFVFSTFSTTQLSLPSLSSFMKIVPMVESYENFIKSLKLPYTGFTLLPSLPTTEINVFAHGGNRPFREGRSCGNGRFQRSRPIRC